MTHGTMAMTTRQRPTFSPIAGTASRLQSETEQQNDQQGEWEASPEAELSQIEKNIIAFNMPEHARELTRQVNRHVIENDSLVRQQIVNIMESGRKLESIKAMIPHGQWVNYITYCTEYRSVRQAQRDMRFWLFYKDKSRALRTAGIITDYDEASKSIVYSFTDEDILVTASALATMASKDVPAEALDMMLSKLEKMRESNDAVNRLASNEQPVGGQQDGNESVTESVASEEPVANANGQATPQPTPQTESQDNVPVSRQGTFSVVNATRVAECAKAIESLETDEGKELARFLYDSHDVMNASILEMCDDLVAFPDVVSEMKMTGAVYVPGLDNGDGKQVPLSDLGRTDVEVVLGANSMEGYARHYQEQYEWEPVISFIGTREMIIREAQRLMEDTAYRIKISIRK